MRAMTLLHPARRELSKHVHSAVFPLGRPLRPFLPFLPPLSSASALCICYMSALFTAKSMEAGLRPWIGKFLEWCLRHGPAGLTS